MFRQKYSVLILGICILLRLNGCTPKTTPIIDISLHDEDTEAYVLVRNADFLNEAFFESERLATIYIGTKLNVLSRDNDWVHVSITYDSVSIKGYVHASQLTGNADAVDTIVETGFLPRRILCADSSAKGKELFHLLGADVEVQFTNKESGIIIEKMLFQPGDGIWFSDQSTLDDISNASFKQLGVRGKVGRLTPRTLYCLTQKMTLAPLRETLGQLIAEPERTVPNVMAFKIPPDICVKPVDAIWILEGKILAVADAERGLILLNVNPPHRAYQMFEEVTRKDEAPSCLIDHSGMLVVGWQGKQGQLIGYSVNQDGLKESVVLDIKYRPTVFYDFEKKILVGTKEGHLLIADMKEKKILTDKKVLNNEIRNIQVREKNVLIAGGNSGLQLLEVTSDFSFQKKSSYHSTVESILWISKEDILLSERGSGLMWLRTNNIKDFSATELSTLSKISGKALVRNKLPVGIIATSGEGEDYFVVATGHDIKVLKGSKLPELNLSHSIDIPAERLVWGVDLLAALTQKTIWFVSLSEIISSDYTKSIFAIIDPRFQLTPKGFEVTDAIIAGIEVHKHSDLIDIHFQYEPLDNRFTIVEGTQTSLTFGWTVIRNGEKELLASGTQISVGKGGATLFGHRYSAGDIIEFTATGQPILVGRWPLGVGGTSYKKFMQIQIPKIDKQESRPQEYITGIHGLSYTNTQFGCQISAPNNNWEITDKLPQMDLPAYAPSWKIIKLLTYFQKKNESANVSLIVEKSIGASIEEYERSARQFSKEIEFNAQFEPSNFFSFKGFPAFERRGQVKYDNIPARLLTTTIKRGDFFYIITFTDESDRFDSNLPEFKKIIESFKFIKQD